MLLREAKRILNRNGYRLVEQSEFDAYETALIKKLETIEGVSKAEVNRDGCYTGGVWGDSHFYSFRVVMYSDNREEQKRIATECEEIAKNSAKLYGSGATISRPYCNILYRGNIYLEFEITIK